MTTHLPGGTVTRAIGLSLALGVTMASATGAQTPVAAVQSPPEPATSTPWPNRANDVLPPWLRVRGEFRERMEGVRNAAFTDGRDDVYYLTRVRLSATVAPRKDLVFQAQVQDARVGDKAFGPTGAPFSGALDLRMAFADIGAGSRPFTVRAGRQELAYGDQRLVGHLSWTNTARTFDGVKLTARSKAVNIEAFATSLVRIVPDAFDRSGNGNRFAGAYASTSRLLPGATVEPYVFYRRDVDLRSEFGTSGTLNQYTPGVRLAGVLPAAFDYNVEVVGQTGSLGQDSVGAWAGHWLLRYRLPGRAAPHLLGEYNFASGDEDPGDGRRGTFDQLYPTAHEKYGLADQVGWRNIHDLRVGFDVTPVKATLVTANYHSYWLAERRDGLYNSAGALIARIAAGAPSAHVGQEIDVQVVRPLTPQVQVAAGWSHLFTGTFLELSTPGASYGQSYLMLTYVFLAAR